jgi:endo-1,4-beta-mannosidase
MNSPGVSYNDTLLALTSLKASGIRYFRFFASLWGPTHIYWHKNSAAFWAEFDRLMGDIERLGLYCIPSIGYTDWFQVANLAFPGLNETANDMVRNSTSRAQALAFKYFEELVSRYQNRSAVLLWELGNELNLQVNLPPPWCGHEQCFSTQEMVKFTKELVSVIRRFDRLRPISSGFSTPRPSAWFSCICTH